MGAEEGSSGEKSREGQDCSQSADERVHQIISSSFRVYIIPYVSVY